MAKEYNVVTRFGAKDATSKVVKKMNSNVGRFGASMKNASGMANKGFQKANKSVNRLATVGLASAVVFAGLATREFINLESSIVKAGSKFKDLDSQSLGFKDSLKELTATAREVGAVTEFTATDAAGALDKFAMAGISSNVAMNLLMGTTDLATSAGTDLTTAVDIATDSLGAFGITAKMTGDKVKDAMIAQQGLANISDVFVKTTTTANTSLEELFETAKKAGPTFTATGQSLETFATFAGIMANSGIKAEEAGTQLKNMMLALAKVTPQAQKQLSKLKVVTTDSNGNFRDAIDILSDFEKGLKGMGNQQRASALTTIFGKRSVTGLNILLQEGTKKLRDYRGVLLEASGASNQMAESIRKSLMNQIKVLNSSLVEFGLKIIEAFSKDGQGGLESLIKMVQNLDPKPFVAFGRAVISVMGFLGDNWKILVTIAATIKSVVIAMSSLNAITAIFGITLAATPIGWIIGIVALLAAGITLLILNWDKVTYVMKNLGWYIKYLFNTELNSMIILLGLLTGPIGLVVGAIALLIANWDKVTEAVKGFAITVRGVLADALSGALGLLQEFLELLGKIPLLGGTYRFMAKGIETTKGVVDEYKTPTAPNPTLGSSQSSKAAFSAKPDGYYTPGGSGAIDVNFSNVPSGVDIKETKKSDSMNLNIDPTFAF